MAVLRRTPFFEKVADLGNDCLVESYWPDDEYHPQPRIYVRQRAAAAPLTLDQVAKLQGVLAGLLRNRDPAS